MRRVHTTFDLLEAHIVTALLRHNGIEVWFLDVDMLRQNWFKLIAFGGFRLEADAASLADAAIILDRYRNGAFALPDDPQDACPVCRSGSVVPDAQPRRNVFLALIVLSLLEGAAWLGLSTISATSIVVMFAVQYIAALCVPWLVVLYFKWRMRCGDCRHRWRARPQRFCALAAMADEGARTAS